MKKSDADALAVRILLAFINSGKTASPNEKVLQEMARWSEMLQQHGDDDINLSLIAHSDKSS